MRITTRTVTAVAGVLLTGTVVAATTGTASAAPAPPAHDAIGASGAVVRGNASSVAGYGTSLAQFTSPKQWNATATYTVPAVTCTADTTGTLFVEMFFNGTDQSGNGLSEGSYLAVTCVDGVPTYGLNVSAQGGANGGVGVPTAPGDSVTVTFAATTKSEVSTVTDTTTGATGSQAGTGFMAVGGMQVSVQAGDAHSVFPRFDTVSFSRVVAAGVALAALNPYRFDAYGSGGAVKVRTGPIATAGRGFVVKFVAEFTPGA